MHQVSHLTKSASAEALQTFENSNSGVLDICGVMPDTGLMVDSNGD